MISKQVNTYIDPKKYEMLKAIAKEKESTISKVVKSIIEKQLPSATTKEASLSEADKKEFVFDTTIIVDLTGIRRTYWDLIVKKLDMTHLKLREVVADLLIKWTSGEVKVEGEK